MSTQGEGSTGGDHTVSGPDSDSRNGISFLRTTLIEPLQLRLRALSTLDAEVDTQTYRALVRTIDAIADFMTSCSETLGTPQHSSGLKLISDAIKEVGLDNSIYELMKTVTAWTDVIGSNAVLDRRLQVDLRRILDAVSKFRAKVNRARRSLESTDAMDLLRTPLNNLGGHVGAAKIQAEMIRARDEANEVLQDARRAAGQVGVVQLGHHFEEYASREARVADRLRMASLAIVIVIAGAAAVFLLRTPTGEVDVVPSELLRLSITIPLIALAGYLGRESSRHRRISNWARQREVQLKTLEAYIAPMSDRDKQRLRFDLGKRVFGSDLPEQAVKEDSPDLIQRTLSRNGTTRKSGTRPALDAGNSEHRAGADPA